MEWALPFVALVVLGFASVSRLADGTSLTPAMAFTGAGLLAGAETFGLVDPAPAGRTVRLLAEATLAIVLFSDAARVDLRALRDEYRVPARLLGIGLPLTIAAGFGVAVLLFDAMAWPEALVLAVVLAPTDAALGQAVVTMPVLPSRIRQGLNVESGLNDGICVPLFFGALAVATAEAGIVSDGHAATLLVEEIGYGALVGAGAGLVAALLVLLCDPRGLIDPVWRQVVPVAAAALAYTTAAAVDGSGFIAAFVGGLVFGGLRRRVGGEVGYLAEELGGLLAAATFVVFGGTLLAPALGELTWAVAGYAVLSLTLVRMVPVAVAMLGTRARPPTVGFLGWFGPRGLASVVFAVLLVEAEGTLPQEQTILNAIFVTIGLSVLAHGVTAAPIGRRYARWYADHPERESLHVETGDARHVPWRRPVAR